MSAPPLLQTEALSVEVAGRPVCRALDLTLHAGEVLAVVGRNGVGKSTLLSTLAGLRASAGGTVRVAGRALAHWPARELARQRALLTQAQEDAFAASVLETVLVGRHPHIGRWGSESEADVCLALDALEAVSLRGFAARDVRTLSGGERQRVALAAVLVQDAPLCLLDEPVTHLDLDYQVESLELFSHLARSRARAVVAVLHDLNLVLRCCDRVLLLLGGGEVRVGPVEAVLQAPVLSQVFCHPLRELREGGRRYFVPA